MIVLVLLFVEFVVVFVDCCVVVDIVAVDREPEKVYQPGHPKADKDGYIYTAAVDAEEEMVEMLEASRQYENNVEVISTLRGLMMRTINMGK